MRRAVGASAVALLAVLGLFPVPSAQAATLSLSPGSGSYAVGQSFTVSLRLNAAGVAVNAAEGTVTWSSSTLELRSLSTSGSIFKFWPIEPEAHGSSSAIFSGGLPNPGYSGSSGTVLTLTFRGTATGTATVRLTGGKVLANDGQGTDVLTGSGSASYTITAATTTPSAPAEPGRPTPTVSSVTHPDPAAWYRESAATVAWTTPAGMTGVSYQLTADAGTVPDESVEPSGTSTTVSLPWEGTWYFHLRARYATGWSAPAHFALRLDTTPPEPFVPTVTQDRGPTDPSPILAFTTTDAVSGVLRYTYRIDRGPTVEAASPTTLVVAASGTHTVTVAAYDLAGNTRDGSVAFITEGYPAPTVLSVSSPLVLLDPLVVRGLANAGDTVVVAVDGVEVGRTVALGASDQRVEWTVGTDRIFRPGAYAVTATATAPDGQTSVPTDGVPLRIVGWAILVNGRLIATFSVLAPVAILLGLVGALAGAYLVRIWIRDRRLRRGIRAAEDDLEGLRNAAERGGVTRSELSGRVQRIEEELGDAPNRRRARTRSTRRSR